MRRRKYKYYKTLDTCPVWNFFRASDSNDARYLLKLDDVSDYNKLPKIREDYHIYLAKLLANMTLDLGNRETSLARAKSNLLASLMDLTLLIAKHSKDVDKIKRASILIRGLMISSSPVKSWLDHDFCETPEQKMQAARCKVAIHQFLTVKEEYNKKKEEKPASLEEQVARLEAGLGVNIDVYKTSVRQFQAYSDELKAKQKAQLKAVGNK